MKIKSYVIIIVILILLNTSNSSHANWTTLDYPGAISTYVYGIDGGTIVGGY